MGMELGIKILELLVSVVIARYLAPKGYGLLSFAVAFGTLFSILPASGISTLVTRDLARDSSELNRYLSVGLALKVLLSILTLITIALAGWWLKFGFEKWLVVILGSLLVLMEKFLGFTSSFFGSQQKMGMVAALNLAMRLAWMGSALTVIFLKGGLVAILTTRILVSCFVIGFSLRMIHVRLGKFLWSFDWSSALRMFKASLPFALFQVSVMIYVKIDVVMLSLIRGDTMTGWYAVAQRCRSAMGFIPGSVADAALPAMSKFSRASPKKLVDTIHHSCKYLWIISLPLAILISLLARDIVTFLYGDAFGQSVPALSVVIWTMTLSFVNNVFTTTLYAINWERKAGWAVAFGALFNIVTNLMAIPIWGHVGAATTTVLSEAAVFILQWRLVTKALPEAKPIRQLAKPSLAALLMMLFTWVARRNFGFFPALLGSVFVYFFLLVAFRAVGREEWELAKGMFPSREVEEPL